MTLEEKCAMKKRWGLPLTRKLSTNTRKGYSPSYAALSWLGWAGTSMFPEVSAGRLAFAHSQLLHLQFCR